jgi:hypothetical protein
MVERQDSSQILATHNGQAFRFNELVHIFEGTAPGVRAGKTEFMKAWFKGVDVKSDKFVCRPVIGYSRGPFPRFSKGSVFKVKVFTLTLGHALCLAFSLTMIQFVSCVMIEVVCCLVCAFLISLSDYLDGTWTFIGPCAGKGV